jgi:hypothetical protein
MIRVTKPEPFRLSLRQVSPPEANPSRFASFTQSGETKDLRRKALNFAIAPTRAGATR